MPDNKEGKTSIGSQALRIIGLLAIVIGVTWLTSYESVKSWQKIAKGPPSVEEARRSLQEKQSEIQALAEQSKQSTAAVVSVLLKDARMAIVKKDYQKALEIANQIIQTDNSNTDAYRLRGNAYHGLGNYDKAVADYSQAMKLKPDVAATYLQRAVAYMAKSDNENAIKDATASIKIKPDYGEAYYYRAVAYQRAGHTELANNDFKKACELGVERACSKVQ